ncbi:Mobile element protein [Candidatus Enterovibrio altilux]|uniref:Mobile element protein n=1 Tax=Candidatus Enterovibrio altilux TaxID=1927128 RepID=A0A291B6M3_9GAMM|nr:Mobile element protein [Candidatus Enterovibrio luxaltus]
MSLKGLQGSAHSIFILAQLSLLCSHYSYISKRIKVGNVVFKTKTRGTIPYYKNINSIAISYLGIVILLLAFPEFS